MTTPDHNTFDIREGLLGTSLPEDKVTVYQDSKTAFLLKATNDEISRLRANKETDKAKQLEAEADKYVQEIAATSLEVSVKALPKDDRNALVKDALEKFPEETDFLGRAQPNRERDEYFTNRHWAAHIVSIKSAAGTDTAIDHEKVAVIRVALPDPSLARIGNAIDGLYEGAASGFEQALQDVSFSSAA